MLHETKDSIVTFGSGSISSKHEEEICMEDLSDEELRQALRNAIRWTRILEIENDIFERFLLRFDPDCIQKIENTLETMKSSQKTMPQLISSPSMSLTGSVVSVRDRGSQSLASLFSESRHGMHSQMARRLKISLNHRMEMATNEIAEQRAKVYQYELTIEKEKTKLKAEVEELELRIRENSEALKEFEENVVIKGIDPITGKIPAEKVIKYVENWVRIASRVIERIRLKSATTRSQIKRAKHQLVQREEFGEDLRPADFEQLRIENQNYSQKIETANRYLLDVKKVTGQCSIDANKHKAKLFELSSVFDEIMSEIFVNKYNTAKLYSEIALVDNEVQKSKNQVDALVALMEEYEVPDILDFVKLRAEVQILQKAHSTLKRHSDIQDMLQKFRNSKR